MVKLLVLLAMLIPDEQSIQEYFIQPYLPLVAVINEENHNFRPFHWGNSQKIQNGTGFIQLILKEVSMATHAGLLKHHFY